MRQGTSCIRRSPYFSERNDREMKVLITGFEPFGGEKINPAWEAVKHLPDSIGGAEIIKREIPTVFEDAQRILEREVSDLKPDLLISVGQAGGRSCVTVERIAVNLIDARIPDNAGIQPVDVPVQPGGEDAYFSTLPVKTMAEYVCRHGLPCDISYSAGTFVCNCVMYRGLYLCAHHYPKMRAGFIHVPYLPQQTAQKPQGTAAMSLADITESLCLAVEAAVKSCV